MTTQISPGAKAGAGGRFDDLDGELVAHHPRILQERMLALEDVIVGAADADPARADQHLPGIGVGGGPLLESQLARARSRRGHP